MPVSALQGKEDESSGVNNLLNMILNQVQIPDRNQGSQKDFLFSIDHCFQIKGQGTVITGTVLSGSAQVGDSIEIPALKVDKRIKSM